MGFWDAFKAFRPKRIPLVHGVSIEVTGGRPVWTEQKYTALAQEGYSINPYVYSAINLISRCVSTIPWGLYYFENGDIKEFDEHPALQLWNYPNPYMSSVLFLETIVSHLLIAGDAFIHCISVADKPKELWPIRPDMVQIISGGSTEPVAGYQVGQGKNVKILDTDEMMHLRVFNPLSDFYGFSPLMAAAHAIDQNNAARAWNTAVMQNSGRVGGGYYTDEDLSEEEVARLEQKLRTLSGPENAGKQVVFEGGLKWQETAIKPKDADWLEALKLSSREIAICFGVPPELLGDVASKTFSNLKSAQKMLYEERILPMADWIKGEFNRWLLPKFGENIFLDYDRDDIIALTEDTSELWDRVNNATFLTQNEKRIATRYGEIEGGDVIFIPANIQPQMAVTDAQVKPKPKVNKK